MGKNDENMKSENPFEEMQKRFAELQKQWNALSPEQQEAEQQKYPAYDERVLAELNWSKNTLGYVMTW